MSQEHHLTLAEFIRVYVTTQGDDGYGDRPATRAKRLAHAIYTQPEVLEALRQHPASGSPGIVTVKTLRKEMKALEEAGDMFSAYQVDRGEEKTSRNLRSMRLYLATCGSGRCLRKRAPMLFGLLNGLVAPKTERTDREPRDPSKFNHRIAIINSTAERDSGD